MTIGVLVCGPVFIDWVNLASLNLARIVSEVAGVRTGDCLLVLAGLLLPGQMRTRVHSPVGL